MSDRPFETRVDDYKARYQRIRFLLENGNFNTDDFNPQNELATLSQTLDALPELPEDHFNYLLNSALPLIIKSLLERKNLRLDQSALIQINDFIKRCLLICI